MEGIVISGANNFFCVEALDGSVYHCSIKGKVLRLEEEAYNPLCPGDVVEIEVVESGVAVILSLKKRCNRLKRLNIKTYTPQILCSNIDLIISVTTPSSPPFRPRFVDRLIVEAEREEIPILIVLNKCDLQSFNKDEKIQLKHFNRKNIKSSYVGDESVNKEAIEERMSNWEALGYEVMRVSAKTGENIEKLKMRIQGSTCALVGQSGVGKSSLLNVLEPGLNLKTAAISYKYDRGVHTTTKSHFFRIANSTTAIIDTPGIRNFSLYDIEEEELSLYFREMKEIATHCKFGSSCRHECEAGCAILSAVEDGSILEDRYESYLRIKEEIKMLKEKMGIY